MHSKQIIYFILSTWWLNQQNLRNTVRPYETLLHVPTCELRHFGSQHNLHKLSKLLRLCVFYDQAVVMWLLNSLTSRHDWWSLGSSKQTNIKILLTWVYKKVTEVRNKAATASKCQAFDVVVDWPKCDFCKSHPWLCVRFLHRVFGCTDQWGLISPFVLV